VTEQPILVVDDDLDIREGLTDVLVDHGYEVMTAGNGREALRLLRGAAVRPSVVLLDLMMPVMDGYGFLAERRNDAALKAIPVAIITAGHGVDRARLGNGAPIIRKPIDVEHLVQVIDELRSGAPPPP
jgi:CheY-like chemotaxis protein